MINTNEPKTTKYVADAVQEVLKNRTASRENPEILRIVGLIDVSGSMGEEYNRIFAELKKLHELDSKISITIIEADHAIRKEYALNPGQAVQRDSWYAGGTNFNPALARAKELDPDICFYFTDGYGGPVNTENQLKCPFYWVISGGGRLHDDWGKYLTCSSQ